MSFSYMVLKFSDIVESCLFFMKWSLMKITDIKTLWHFTFIKGLWHYKCTVVDFIILFMSTVIWDWLLHE